MGKIKDMRQDLKYAVNRILQRAGWASEKYHISKLRLIIGYLFCAVFYGCTTIDYFYYKFFFLNRRGKRQFITGHQQAKYEHKHTNKDLRFYLYHKEATLLKFDDFIKRDWCGQLYHNTEEEYIQFAEKHAKGIIKPRGEYGGKGIKIIPTEEIDGMDLYTYCKTNNVMIEELIIQHEGVSAMYPNAINTLRIVTNSGKCVCAAFRMGAGGAEVDNATSGGIFAEIDIETGIVISGGHRMNGESMLTHPDTGVIIPGFKLPMWKECVQLAEDASKVVEEVALIGWDIAVSTDGPTIVEVNEGPGLFLSQIPNGNGIRDKILNGNTYEEGKI